MESVTLWHGTTASAAERIVTEGFRLANPGDIVAETAVEFRVDEHALVELLHKRNNYIVSQVGRADSAWFASSHAAAIGWANRAPEVRWETLWAVWSLMEDTPGVGSEATHPRKAAWHLRQFLADLPAVVEVQVPSDAIPIPTPRRGPVGSSDENRRSLYLDMVSQGKIPQVALPLAVPVEWVLGYEVVERRVPFGAAAGLLRRTCEELDEMVESGELVRFQQLEAPPQRWWVWDDLVPYLDHRDVQAASDG
jgi:hypothetical protein